MAKELVLPVVEPVVLADNDPVIAGFVAHDQIHIGFEPSTEVPIFRSKWLIVDPAWPRIIAQVAIVDGDIAYHTNRDASGPNIKIQEFRVH